MLDRFHYKKCCNSRWRVCVCVRNGVDEMHQEGGLWVGVVWLSVVGRTDVGPLASVTWKEVGFAYRNLQTRYIDT